MKLNLRYENILNLSFGEQPHPRQDIPFLIFFWIIASLPWLAGVHFIPYDSVDEFYPQSYFVAESIREGNWPWWNPYKYAGLPVWGDPQSMIFTLHTWIGVLIGSEFTLQVFDALTLLHILVGGIGVYALGLVLGAPRVWVLAAAMLFMFGGVATSRLQHLTQIISYSWLPVIFWLVVKIGVRPNIFLALLLGLVGAFWAANPNQVVFLGSLLLLSLTFFLLVRSHQWRRLLSMYLLAALISLLLLLPFYTAMVEIIGISDRSGLSLNDSRFSSFNPIVYASLVLPALYGNLGGTNWSPTSITQDYLYLGIIPLALYLAAMLAGLYRRNNYLWLWALALAFFIMFSLGVNSPFYPFLFEYVPGFDYFRRPADAAYLINFLLAAGLLLLGRNLVGGSQGNVPVSYKFTPFYGLLFVGSSLLVLPFASSALGAAAHAKDALQVLYASYWGLIIRILVFIFLLSMLNELLARTWRWKPWVILSVGIFMAVDYGLAGRYSGLFSLAYNEYPVARSYLTKKAPEEDKLDGWLRNHTAPWSRVEVIGGHQAMGHASKVRWYNTQGHGAIRLSNYSNQIGAFLPIRQPRTFPEDSLGVIDTRYDILGMTYVAFPTWLLDPRKFDSPVAMGARAYRDSIVTQGGEMVFAADNYEVWLRPKKDLWLSLTNSSMLEELSAAPCKLLDYQNSSLRLSCDIKDAARLVLGEVYAPGWMACVNGESVKIEPFFDVFRSVILPPGRSDVIMRYRPIPFLRWMGC